MQKSKKMRALFVGVCLALVVCLGGVLAQAATVYKVLGQAAPSATTATTLYTVPSSTSTVVATITVCNRDSSAGTFRIAIRPAGATLANQHYIAYDVPIAANDTIPLTFGITLATTDVVTVYASSANQTFNIFGAEIQ